MASPLLSAPALPSSKRAFPVPYYDNSGFDVTLTIVRCTNLENKHIFAKDDPYCRIFFGNQTFVTNVAHSSNPEWNFVCNLGKQYLLFPVLLKIEVWDRDTLSPDEFLGAIEVGAEAILDSSMNGNKELVLPLMKGKQGFITIKFITTMAPYAGVPSFQEVDQLETACSSLVPQGQQWIQSKKDEIQATKARSLQIEQQLKQKAEEVEKLEIRKKLQKAREALMRLKVEEKRREYEAVIKKSFETEPLKFPEVTLVPVPEYPASQLKTFVQSYKDRWPIELLFVTLNLSENWYIRAAKGKGYTLQTLQDIPDGQLQQTLLKDLAMKEKDMQLLIAAIDEPEYPLFIRCIKFTDKTSSEMFQFLTENGVRLENLLTGYDKIQEPLAKQLSAADMEKLNAYIAEYKL